jgi:hypothetical protein
VLETGVRLGEPFEVGEAVWGLAVSAAMGR